MSHNDGLTNQKGFANEETLTFSLIKEKDDYILEVMSFVYDALSERGYNPTSQIVGYLISGDPTYITAYHEARSNILKFSKEEILEALIHKCLR